MIFPQKMTGFAENNIHFGPFAPFCGEELH